MVNTATAARIWLHSGWKSGKATKKTRPTTAKPAALDAVERKAEMGVGAPS